MGWLITLAILFLLAILPLGAMVKYDASGVLVKVIAGPIRITVFPMKSKKPAKKEKRAPEKQEKKEAEPAPPPKPQKEAAKKPAPKKEGGGKITDFLPLLGVVFDLLWDLKWKLRVDRLEANIVMAGGDPADLAINYARTWAAIGNLFPQLERFFVIKDRDIRVECDFLSSETKICARLDLTITLGRIISLVCWYGIRALWEYLKIMKKRKGGAAL